jgi:acyl carrier protein
LPSAEWVQTQQQGPPIHNSLEAFPAARIADQVADILSKLLNVQSVGYEDDFFELGGHSLLVTRTVSRLRDAFGVEIPFDVFFETSTVAGVATVIAQLLSAEDRPSLPPVRPVGRDDELPLSFTQQRLWFLQQLSPDSDFYNVSTAFRIRGLLDPDALRRAVTEVVARHESLRTTFPVTAAGTPVQVIQPARLVSLPVMDLTVSSDGSTDPVVQAEVAERARRIASELVRAPFDLATQPGLRATLLRLGELDHMLVLVMHHLVVDGWSIAVLNKELGALYSAFSTAEPNHLTPLTIQYADYAVWQHEWLSGPDLGTQLRYWRTKLRGMPVSIELPADRLRPQVASHRGATLPIEIPAQTIARLNAIAATEGATLYMVLLAAFKALLVRYTGQVDIVVGTTVANRRRAELESLIGLFVNTLVLRTDCAGSPTFRELLARVRETALGAYAHQDVPFHLLVDEFAPNRDLSRNPLVQIAFQLHNTDHERLHLGNADVTFVRDLADTVRFDLEVHIAETATGATGMFVYATDLYDPPTISRLAGSYLDMLKHVTQPP